MKYISVVTKYSGILHNVNRRVWQIPHRCVSLDLRGIFPPIPTPFDDNERISFDDLKQNFIKWNEIPFRGYLVQGSNGESVYLNITEKVELVQESRVLIPKDKLLIAGSGCESTRMTIELTKQMAKAGADAALIITPSYFKGRMNNEAMLNHYSQVADQSPIPIILYNFPGNTGIDLSPDVIITLASHPNIIGIKESSNDITKIGFLISKTSHLEFQVLGGTASVLLPTLCLGGVGVMSALANVLGQKVCDLHKLYQSGNMKTAAALQLQLIAPNTAVTKSFGIPGLKAAMELFGFYGGLPRKPLMPLSDSEKEVLKKIFKDSKFL